jgi:hypothetical protein
MNCNNYFQHVSGHGVMFRKTYPEMYNSEPQTAQWIEAFDTMGTSWRY